MSDRPTKPISSAPRTRCDIVARIVEINKKIQLLEQARDYWTAELDKLSDTDTEV